MLDLGADQLVSRQPEEVRADLVAVADDAALADREQRVGHAVKNGLHRGRVGQRLGDRRFHLVVVLVDQLQQLDEVGSLDTRRLGDLLDFVADVLVHLPASSIR